MTWIIGLCAVCFGICLPLFMHYKKSLHLYMAASYKTLGTLCAFLPALIAAFSGPHAAARPESVMTLSAG